MEPLATDGVRVVVAGTVLWAVALVLALVFYGDLSDDGRGWYAPAAGCGIALGLIGIAYCTRRRDALRAEGQAALDDALAGKRVEL